MSALAPPANPPAAIRRPRKGTALALTILALLLTLGAYALVGYGKAGELPESATVYAGVFLAGYLGAHLLMRRYALLADPVLFPTAALLAGIGFATIFRLSGNLAAEQITWLVVGLLAFAVTLLVIRDDRQLDAYTFTIGLAGIVLLLLPIVPGLGVEVNGARLWVELGTLRFQPAELGKVLLVVFLASYLTRKRELLQLATIRLGPMRFPQPKHLGPVLLAWGVSLIVLFVERDMGASLLFFGIFVVMLWVATARPAYLVIGLLLFALGAWFGYQRFDHVQTRVEVWHRALEPAYVQGAGGQLAQGQFAMATGGIGGVGLGRGQPYLIPFASTDFIFAAIGEELGLLGTTGVLLLFLVLVSRGYRIALSRSDGFGKLLATGLVTIVGLQTFIIVGGVTRLIPLTGITTPFVSYGGSSLVSNFILLAILVRVSAGPHERRERAIPGLDRGPAGEGT